LQDLLGRRALVTGGSRGIGAAIAVVLAENGADVAISYERAADRAQEIVRQIESKGGEVSPSRRTAPTRRRTSSS
jgi:NAD(P)-dependent dehydrogenase (short-subunit alcohol dehydrogenase family)